MIINITILFVCYQFYDKNTINSITTYFISTLKNNLKPDGYFVCGIADFEDEGYHVTLQNKEWWIKLFENHKMKFVEEDPQELARKTSFHLKFKLMEN